MVDCWMHKVSLFLYAVEFALELKVYKPLMSGRTMGQVYCTE